MRGITTQEQNRQLQLVARLERQAEELEQAKQERIAATQRVSRAVDFTRGGYTYTESGHCFSRFGAREEKMIGHLAYLAESSTAKRLYREWMNE